jgi:inositol oxygenase
LTCTSDTPPRRQHYRNHWMKQTVSYVEEMKKRYLGFGLKEISLRVALNLSICIPAYSFAVNNKMNSVSLRTRCFRAAEYFRNAGHPDWVQLLALVYALGGVVNCIDMQSAIESEDDYDWTIPSRSRVVGCLAPNSVVFGEFRSLNADENDPRYSSAHGHYDLHCGLDNVALTWTGPEYMYHMLKHNQVDIPEEGLKLLRLASLSDWHTKHLYAVFADDDDIDMQSFISDFDELLLAAKRETLLNGELTSEECDRLWNTHYGEIASKYNMDGNLKW